MREIQVQQAAGPSAHGYVVKQEVVTDGKGGVWDSERLFKVGHRFSTHDTLR